MKSKFNLNDEVICIDNLDFSDCDKACLYGKIISITLAGEEGINYTVEKKDGREREIREEFLRKCDLKVAEEIAKKAQQIKEKIIVDFNKYANKKIQEMKNKITELLTKEEDKNE